jgi:hypothetical protein
MNGKGSLSMSKLIRLVAPIEEEKEDELLTSLNKQKVTNKYTSK